MESSWRKANPNPRDSASLPSLLFNTWLVPLFWRGWKKPVEVEDLYDPLKRDRSTQLGDQLSSQWEAELKKSRGADKSPSLIRCLLRTFHPELLFLAAVLIFQTISSITQSFLLGKLLAHFRPNSTVSREAAMSYTGGMLACAFVELILRNKYEISAFHSGLRVRAACCALIYRKSLKLSVTALGEMASGQAVNLLSNDVSRFDLMMVFLHYMWMAPLVTAAITFLLYRDGGVPALFGLSVMILIVLCQAYIGRLSSIFRRRIAFRTDERIRLVNEVISGINVIKMYAWENPFIQLMRNARRRELRELRKTSMVRGIYMTFHLCANRMALFCAVIALYLFGFSISADKVFVFISYFNILTWILGGMFVRGCAEVSECYVSIQRIQKYLMNEEYKDDSQVSSTTSLIKCKDGSLLNKFIEPQFPINGNKNVINSLSESKPVLSKHTVVLSNVSAKWNIDATEPTLHRINISASRGQLLAIIGPVGAGKSSVLQAILGELPVCEGSIEVNGITSYAGQDPWVFAATVRQNILFGASYDKKRYEKVIKACALQKDFEQFSEGDMTVVGERGVSLSGGQRARVNLARAVYRDTDIYLLDDPLSAVDTHVGRHLYDECIRGYLKHKTVILVTHQLQYLRDADCILLMRNGASLATGTYQDIISSGIDYGKLLEVEDESKPADPKSDEINSLNPLKRLVSAERKKSTASSFTSSMHSIQSNDSDTEDKPPQATSPLVDKLEATSKGVVEGSLYLHYFKSGGSVILFFVVGVLFLLTQITVSFTDYWIAFWTKLEDTRPILITVINGTNNTMLNTSTTQTTMNMSGSSNFLASNLELTTETCLYIYAAIVSCTLLVCVVRTTLYYYMVLRICDRLHKSMFQAVIGTTMRFFDTNPSGRILNRFSKDMGSVDEILPKIILDSVQILLSLLGAVCLTVLTNYFLLIPLICMGILFRFVQRFYLRTAKSIKRLEGIVRSPVFSHLNATLQGMVTIRAFGAEELLKNEFDKHQDLHSSAWYLHLSGSNAFGLTLELSSFIYNIIVLTSIFLGTHERSGGEVGLAITQCIILNGFLQWGVRQSAEVANNMMSAERVLEYTQLLPEEEKPSAATTTSKIGKTWPSKGSITMDHVYLRYAPNDAPVLQDLNICIKPGEKIGIVGRTGAGKSSLIATMFRMAVVEGRVIIDDIESSDVTLSRLRSSISIIPQDPVLFSGTMRRNLDPFQEYPDEKLWTALSEVELKQLLKEQEGLDTRVLESGSNFSVGQRQLVCLARAILRANRILMMDEATANVDPQTDQLIQSTIREKFKACTVLTVAHRLNTVIDSDRVLVMENGSVAEFDHPYRLLEKPGGVFRAMVYKMGAHGAEQLYQAAKHRFESPPGSI